MSVRVVPWIRSGLGLEAATEAVDGQTDVLRATATIEIAASANDGAETGTAITQQVELYGPGDIASLEEQQVRHRYPTPGTPDAEWNFFAFVELTDADLPWRYSPAGPDVDGRVAPPWLALVVVEEGEEATYDTSARLPVLRVESADHLPPPNELWAWAHAYGAGDPSTNLAGFNARIVCPRRLRPHTHWRACLVPAFEAGRRAGLGMEPGSDTGPAWTTGATNVELPVYTSWTFATGDRDGTFLSLAQKLMPRELGPEVGVRPLDLREPGTPLPSSSAGRMDFVGAMFSPQYDEQSPASADLDAFAAVYVDELTRDTDGPSDPNAYNPMADDPLVRLPRYGSPQFDQAFPDEATNWYRELNTRPDHRSVAALGASVVRADQEALMAAAWEHAASLTQINESLQRARLAEETAAHRRRKFGSLDVGQRFQLSGPAAAAVIDGDDNNLLDLLDEAAVPSAVAGGAFRRMSRTGGPFQRATTAQPATATTPAPVDHFVSQTLTEGAAAFVEPEPTLLPAGLDIGARPVEFQIESGVLDASSFQQFDAATLAPTPGSVSSIDVTWSSPTGGLAIGTATLSPSAPPTPLAPSAGGPLFSGVRRFRRISAPSVVPGLRPNLQLNPPTADPFAPGWAYDEGIPPGDVLEVLRNRILDQATHLVAQRPGDLVRRGTEAEPLPVFDADVDALLTSSVDPAAGIRRWVDEHVAATDDQGGSASVLRADDAIPPALFARPHFALPMYERLRALSVEYIVPGIGAVPANTVGALTVNNAFVESFLVGANHELSREFRWREYPAPLHRTWFDQFWDTSDGSVDIAPIRQWETTQLGTHAQGGERLVILVKGELIDRFPNLAVYMAQAALEGGERVMADLPPELPVFSGKLLSGVYFYGFELPTALADQVTEAQVGGDAQQGWFFGLEEQPRSPRFGLDVGMDGHVGASPESAIDLSWRHLQRSGQPGPLFVDRSATPSTVSDADLGTGAWFADSAVMAATTFQRPTRVLIHATALLEGDNDA